MERLVARGVTQVLGEELGCWGSACGVGFYHVPSSAQGAGIPLGKGIRAVSTRGMWQRMQPSHGKHPDPKGWLLLSQNHSGGKSPLRSSNPTINPALPELQRCGDAPEIRRCWKPLELLMGSHSSQIFGNTVWKIQNSVDVAGRDTVIPIKNWIIDASSGVPKAMGTSPIKMP